MESTRHVDICPPMRTAIGEGFLIAAGDEVHLGERVSHAVGTSASQFVSRIDGPTIAFCPFCGALSNDSAAAK